MDRTFQVAIRISVLLFVAALHIFFRDPLQRTVRDTWSRFLGTEVTVASAPSPAPAVTPPTAKAKPRLPRHDSPEPAVAAPAEKAAAPVITPKTEAAVLPFPTGNEVKAGMTRKEMMSKFGAPNVTASWSENGSLAEKFIYTREAQVTAVILRDGEVVTSRTGPHDPWELFPWWQAGAIDKPRHAAESADRDRTKAH